MNLIDLLFLWMKFHEYLAKWYICVIFCVFYCKWMCIVNVYRLSRKCDWSLSFFFWASHFPTQFPIGFFEIHVFYTVECGSSFEPMSRTVWWIRLSVHLMAIGFSHIDSGPKLGELITDQVSGIYHFSSC